MKIQVSIAIYFEVLFQIFFIFFWETNKKVKSKMEIGNKRKLEDSDDENPG